MCSAEVDQEDLFQGIQLTSKDIEDNQILMDDLGIVEVSLGISLQISDNVIVFYIRITSLLRVLMNQLPVSLLEKKRSLLHKELSLDLLKCRLKYIGTPVTQFRRYI